ncbi:DUF5658 family protein [Mesobacillus campisalis]|uniref:DUF5658 family protein n=1 Tax=Mesobacillus campisalis TaxID=1408103 RepID=UPI00069B5973|nr:DUF5658 family protein [Mesobacillus campisalis]
MKKLFHYLSLLNLFDAFVTHYGLKNGLITESNPFMDRAYQADPVLFLLIKLSLSCLLYVFIAFNKVPATVLVKGVTIFASVCYTLVFALHCWWLLFL